MPKNAAIHASFGLMGNPVAVTQCQVKGDHHAREVLRFNDNVTNFGPKTDFQGSRENLHLVERWTRTGPTTLEYVVTIEDPTVWTKAWTVKEEFTKQNDQDNRLYTEPRCVEGNYGLPGDHSRTTHGRARLCRGTRS